MRFSGEFYHCEVVFLLTPLPQDGPGAQEGLFVITLHSPMAGHGRPWPAMGAHGRPWAAMTAHGRPWPAMAGHGRPFLPRPAPVMVRNFAKFATHDFFVSPRSGPTVANNNVFGCIVFFFFSRLGWPTKSHMLTLV